jgi:hypothetical protein
MVRRVLIPSVLACALSAAVVPAAQAAKAASTSNPVVTGVRPHKVAIGELLTLNGRGFLPGRLRNTVVFQRDDSEPVFVRADNASSTKISLVVPDKLLPFLTQHGDTPKMTRFKLRVLSRRLGRSFTSDKLSPRIGPPKDTGAGGTTTPPPASTNPGTPPANVPKDSAPAAPPPPAGVPDPRSPDGDCDRDGIPNRLETDADDDLVSDADEINKYKTDWCNPDTDGDGISDGYEIESALDMNSRALPYPGKRPYPNALDGSDATIDHDGDGLTEQEEYSAWARYGGHQLPLNYSDGTQETGGPQAATPPGVYPDVPHSRGNTVEPPNGVLTDDEKDVDGDGLSNWDELHGAFDQFTHMNFAPRLDWLDPDSDGDGINDGADDQDHDGTFGGVDLTNLEEVSAGHDGRVTDPTDPCDPNPLSAFCPQHGQSDGGSG